MDGDARRHHQYGPHETYHVASSTATNTSQHMPPPPTRADTSRWSLSRVQTSGYSGYVFPEQHYSASSIQGGPMQGVEMQYSPTYAQDTTSRQHAMQQQATQQQQPQQYGPYGQSLGSMQPTPPSHVYESVPHYQQRQNTGIELLADRFGEPSFLPTTVGLAPTHYMTSQPEHVAFQHQLHQSRPVPSQSDSQQQSTAMPIAEQQYPEDTQATTSAADVLEDKKRQYQQQLRLTFEAIREGKVNEASDKLSEISTWLLSSIEILKLHFDDPDEKEIRLELWTEFNLCWEALGLKQKDITEEALRTGRQPPDILTAERLHTMVEDLLKLTDSIEQYGLIDYEMGVAEEEIVDIFIKCLELFPTPQVVPQSA